MEKILKKPSKVSRQDKYGVIKIQSKQLNPFIGDMVDVYIGKTDLAPGHGSPQDKASVKVGEKSPRSRAGASNSVKQTKLEDKEQR